MRARALAASIGLLMATLPALAVGGAEESLARAPVTTVQVVFGGRQDAAPQTVMLRREPAALARDESSGEPRSNAARPSASDEPGEPRPLMLLLSAAALAAYVIGRRGVRRP